MGAASLAPGRHERTARSPPMDSDFKLLINGGSRAGSAGQSEAVLNPATQMGPLANARRLEAISRLVEDARVCGASILDGGQRLGSRGFFHAPTVIADVSDDAAILHEEPFGPDAPILPLSNEADMLEKANRLEFGLASYIFANDVRRRQRLTDALEYGVVGVNGVPLAHRPEASLGGWKESGIDTEGGVEILDPYQKTKHVRLC